MMAAPAPPDPSSVERAIKAVAAVLTSIRRGPSSGKDLFDILNDAEEDVLRKHWPKGRPSGDGNSYFDKLMRIRVRRLRWRSRIETGREITWLFVGAAIVLGITWQQFLG